jgi:hypothetical protein
VIPFSTDADGERLTGNLRRIDGEWVARIDGTTIVVTAPTRRAAIAGAIEQTRR